ncbi:hypothetical protein QFC20_004021 [Naganishia adeliensis]|uniref:Uncharacterized protein n=1 Tax=Naganishia adeliensis TaxID=92952 RepID=A0ACC2W4K8_9TREE|nr:hypothetical protein QFC20_004021 [Naganishia adeliensis]
MQQLPHIPSPRQPLPPVSSTAIPYRTVEPFLQRIAYLEDKIVIGEATSKAENVRLEDELDEVYVSLRRTNDDLRELKAENSRGRGDGVRLPHHNQNQPSGDAWQTSSGTAHDRPTRAEFQDHHQQEIQRITVLADQGTRAAQRWRTRSDQLERDCSTLGMEHRATLLQNKQALAQRDAAWEKATKAEGRVSELQKSRDHLEETLRRERSERNKERDVADRTIQMAQDKLNGQEEKKMQLLAQIQGYSTKTDALEMTLADSITARHIGDETIELLQTETSRLAGDIRMTAHDFKLLINELQSSKLNLHSGLRDLEATNDQLTNALKASRTEIQELTAAKEQLQTEASAKAEQVQWLQGRVEELSKDLTEAHTEKEDVEGELEQMQYEKNTLQARLQSAITRLQETESDLEDLREDLDAQRVEMWVTERDAHDEAGKKTGDSPASGVKLTLSQGQQLQEAAVGTSAKEGFVVQSDSGIARLSTDQQTRSTAQPFGLPNFKPSIHANIAGFLAGANAYGSLARYNAVSRVVRNATSPVLYETLILDRDDSEAVNFGDRGEGFALWRHTRYLFLSDSNEEQLLALAACQSPDDADSAPLQTLFPDLRFHLTWDEHTIDEADSQSAEPAHICKRRLEMHGAVESTILHDLLTTLPLRMPSCGKGGAMDVRWHSNARLLNGCLVDPVVRYYRGRAGGLAVHVDFGTSGAGGNRAAVRDLMALLSKMVQEAQIRVDVKEMDGP